MSTFAHIGQAPVMNDVLGTDVPPQWNHLIRRELRVSRDESLKGIIRTIYQQPESGPSVQGEVWQLSSKTAPASQPPTLKVVDGWIQMYLLDGSGSLALNGKEIYIRAGEKVSLKKEDVLSFIDASTMRLFARNERASFIPTDPLPSLKSAQLPSFTPSHLPFEPRGSSHREITSSKGFARSKVG